MNILNFGSLNIDYVYAVDHFVTAGETTGSFSMDRNVGGKGLNQSVAFAKAGAAIYHAGCVGSDGAFLTDYLKKVGVNTDYVKVVDVPGASFAPAWDEEVPFMLYRPYTQEELEQIEADRKQTDAARIAALEEELQAAKILLGVE